MVPRGPDSTEADFFRAFFDDGILADILDETNKYVQWLKDKTQVISPRSWFAFWEDVGVDDILIFLALTLLMPLSKKHLLRDYWK